MSPISPLRCRAAAALAILLALTGPVESRASSAEGGVELLPATAKIVGKTKIDLDKNQVEVVGSWRDPSDYVKWTANFPAAGIYDVVLVYSQADARPGSLMELAVGNQGLQTRLEYTSNWDNPCYVYLGQVQIGKAGSVPVNLRVIEKRAAWVMSVRSIRFQPSQTNTLETPPVPATQPAVP